MKKGKSITLLSIIGVIMAVLIVFTFIRFPMADGVSTYNSMLGAVESDYDINGGSAYILTLSDENEDEVEDVYSVVEDINARLKDLGFSSFKVTGLKPTENTIDDFSIRIEVNALDDQSLETQLINAVISSGDLHFYGGTESGSLEEILDGVKAIDNATLGISYYDGEVNTNYQSFSVKFTDEAKEYLDSVVTGASSYYLKITVGEENDTYGATVLDTSSFSIVESYQNGTLSLSSSADKQLVSSMMMQLNLGGLKYKFDVDDVAKITAPLGTQAKTNIIITVSVILVAIIVLCAVLGKGAGLFTGLSLILFMPIYIAMFVAIPNVVINLGGVFGIFAALILTADGFMVTIKRIKEEFESGKTVKASFRTGFKRSLFPILSSGIISVFTSLFLFLFASGEIKCFGAIFGIGAVLSMVTTILFTRMFAYLILPLVKAESQEKFFNLKREDK